jgi:hypothetical protein
MVGELHQNPALGHAKKGYKKGATTTLGAVMRGGK